MAANAPSNETEAVPGALEMVSSAADKVSEAIIRGIRSGAFVKAAEQAAAPATELSLTCKQGRMKIDL